MLTKLQFMKIEPCGVVRASSKRQRRLEALLWLQVQKKWR